MVIIIIQKREGERRLDSFVATLIVSLRRPLAPLLLLLPERVEQIKLTSLDVPRRFKGLQACDMLDALLVPEDEYSDEEEEPEPAPAKA